MAQCFAELFDLWRQGRIRPADTEAHPLDRFAEALERMQSRQASGRVILQM